MDTKNQIIDMLQKKYNVFMLTKKQLAEVMSLSLSSIDNMLANDRSKLPKFIKMGVGSRSSIRFNITDVAQFIAKEESMQ